MLHWSLCEIVNVSGGRLGFELLNVFLTACTTYKVKLLNNRDVLLVILLLFLVCLRVCCLYVDAMAFIQNGCGTIPTQRLACGLQSLKSKSLSTCSSSDKESMTCLFLRTRAVLVCALLRFFTATTAFLPLHCVKVW